MMGLADDFLHGLDRVSQQSTSQWSACCPAHDDRNASLSIAELGDKLLVHCHAGCGLGDILVAHGREVEDLFSEGRDRPTTSTGPSLPPAPPAPKREERPAKATTMPPPHVLEHWRSRLPEGFILLRGAKPWSLSTLERLWVGFDGTRLVFPNVNADGQLVSYVRYWPGAKPSKSLAVGDRLLWPDPSLIDADHVWLVEGEPDRVSAVELGLKAVALPGVGKWGGNDWTDRFAGKKVTICLDCDAEGRAAALRIRDHLNNAGVYAHVVDLAPARNDGFDLTDALTGATQQNRRADLIAYLEGL